MGGKRTGAYLENCASRFRRRCAVRELSALSISEIAIKQAKGRLQFGKEDALTGLADLKVQVLPYKAQHAYHLFSLPTHHKDPFDRQIIAQALAEGIPVVTSDQRSSSSTAKSK